jgi:hypothetical protein
LQPDYDKYGVASSNDGTVILRIDSDKHLFERVGLVSRRQTEVILNRHADGENLRDEGSFKTVESISVERVKFESRLRDAIVDPIYDGEVSRDQAEALADDLVESSREQWRSVVATAIGHDRGVPERLYTAHPVA